MVVGFRYVSFSVSTEPHSAADIREAVEGLQPKTYASDNEIALLREGKEKAIEILATGVLGDAYNDANWFKVEISGHGALGEADPEPGNHVSIKVARVAPPESPPE